jgi:hypothetical protein
MSNAAFARSDSNCRLRMAQALADTAALAKLSPARQNYILFAHDAFTWWMHEGKAGAKDPGPPGWSRCDQIILHWQSEFGAGKETPGRIEVVQAIISELRAKAKAKTQKPWAVARSWG